MDIGDILNAKGNAAAAAAAAAEACRQQQMAQATPMSNRSNSDMDSEQGSTSSQPQPLHPSDNPPIKYPSPIPSAQSMQMMPSPFQADGLQENSYAQSPVGGLRSIGDGDKKSFACSHCTKGFARRSDLARHERIHSGVRPHVCDWPGCGKQFIQRSALTVHARVHTGEKPHICERCGKPFSDSSSLARHRRIHSGKRPYKCPYANCQKTFTRRTTLTRHQNHHTGTIEEAAAETNAKLSTIQKATSTRPSDGAFSDTLSAHSTPSPSHRPASMSPSTELPRIPSLHRRPSELGYLPPNGSFPPHLRHDFQQPSPRSSPGLPSPSLTGCFNNNVPLHRPSLTSHPSGYAPPQPLEPPAQNDHRGGGSAAASPHLTAIGWGSPSTQNLPSPSAMEAYAYPDPTYGGAPLYYPGSNIRRPQSTEPDQYESKPRNHHNTTNNHNHNHNMHSNLPVGADWGSVPMSMQHMHQMN